MNKKLQELKYDLERETDNKKVHSLIANYMGFDQSIGESDECDCDQCSTRSKIRRQLLEEHNNIEPLIACDNDIEYLKEEEMSESKKPTRKFHVLFNKEFDEPSEDKKPSRVDIDEMFVENSQINKISNARKVLRDAFADDPDFKNTYIANIRMFLNDRAGFLYTDEIINDLLDLMMREKGMI